MKTTLMLALAMASLLSTACNAADLSRAEAKKIIDNSDNNKAKKQRVWISAEAINNCIAQGYFSLGDVWAQTRHQLVVTDKGKAFFDAGFPSAYGPTGPMPASVIPSVPIGQRVVEITGITENSDASKTVEYKWAWDSSSQPKEVQDLIFKGDAALTGKAQFKLYDDGWRAVSFE